MCEMVKYERNGLYTLNETMEISRQVGLERAIVHVYLVRPFAIGSTLNGSSVVKRGPMNALLAEFGVGDSARPFVHASIRLHYYLFAVDEHRPGSSF